MTIGIRKNFVGVFRNTSRKLCYVFQVEVRIDPLPDWYKFIPRSW